MKVGVGLWGPPHIFIANEAYKWPGPQVPNQLSYDWVVAPRATTSLKHSYQVWDVMPQTTFVMHRKVLFLFARTIFVNKL